MRAVVVVALMIALAGCAPERGGDTPRHADRSSSGPTGGPAAPPPVAAPAGANAAATPAPSAPGRATPDPAALARADGYGDLRLGMSVEAARTAWGGELRGDRIEAEGCGYLFPTWAANGGEFGLMFENGRFVRYDVGTGRETAPGGGRVGLTRAEIERLYAGRVQASPHEYVPGAHYLRVLDAASKDRALVFETDEQGRITRWRAGLAPQVDYVEGCA